MPPQRSDRVSERHLAHHASDIVDSLDLEPFCAPDAGDDRRNSPCSPTRVVKILICGHATRARSARGITRKLHEDVFRQPGGATSRLLARAVAALIAIDRRRLDQARLPDARQMAVGT